MPIMLTHGLHDEVIPLSHAQLSQTVLQKQGYQIIWRTYPMGHTLCADELRDIASWLKNILL
jgi:phospholipase/carboxylesterase